MQKAMGAESAPMINSFRAFRASLRNGFSTYRGPFVSIDALLTWSTRDFVSVTYHHKPRMAGDSNYTKLGLARHALTLITAFSTRPLRLASIVGVRVGAPRHGRACVRTGFAHGFGARGPGFVLLASLVSILAGAQLFAIGVIGEYLARIRMRSMDKPPYTIRNATGEGSRDESGYTEGRRADSELARAPWLTPPHAAWSSGAVSSGPTPRSSCSIGGTRSRCSAARSPPC